MLMSGCMCVCDSRVVWCQQRLVLQAQYNHTQCIYKCTGQDRQATYSGRSSRRKGCDHNSGHKKARIHQHCQRERKKPPQVRTHTRTRVTSIERGSIVRDMSVTLHNVCVWMKPRPNIMTHAHAHARTHQKPKEATVGDTA